jgi:predicted nucleic-acid-binding protein
MLAVDTNVVVRYLTADDPEQFARAVAVVEGAETFVSLTVLLETEWVLRSL